MGNTQNELESRRVAGESFVLPKLRVSTVLLLLDEFLKQREEMLSKLPKSGERAPSSRLSFTKDNFDF